MDLVFNALPDVFTYQSLRHATYDAPWLNDTNANKGRRAPVQPQRRPSNGSRGGRDSCDNCPLCQEKQRRPLATYIRSKSRQDKREDASIQEEDEEEEQEQEEQQPQQRVVQEAAAAAVGAVTATPAPAPATVDAGPVLGAARA